MNIGESDLTEFNGQRIQRELLDEQKQQVATIIRDSAQLATTTSSTTKQPVHFLDNQLQQPHDEWATVVRSYGEGILNHDANAIVMDGSFQQHHVIISTHRVNADQKPSGWLPESALPEAVLNAAGSNVTSAQHVQQSEARTLTEGNGVLVPNGSLLNTAPSAHNAEEVVGHNTSSSMRDPQESHHRAAPPAAPLGEVESGEDDSDCVVVPSTERKVEPLKINLARDREPIRTVIKLTSGASSAPDHFQQLSPTIRDVPSSPKITIKPPKPPSVVENSLISGVAAGTSSSASSSSSAEHYSNNCIGYSTVLPSYSSIPKLTIKPIINPADETTSTESSSTAAGSAVAGTGSTATVEQMHIIPKLLIKGSASSLDASHGREGAMEPHIVPKLTIRGVNNHNHHHQQQQQHHFAQSQLDTQIYPSDGLASVVLADGGLASSRGECSGTGSPTPLVPKLTIKMDNHHSHHHHHHHHHNSLRVKEVSDGVDTGSGVSGGPIPKLHIKTNQQDGTTMAVNSSHSSSGNCSNPATGSSPVLTSLEGVKVTIKPLPEPPKLPKLTIKTTGLGTVAETSDVSMVSSTSNSFSPKLLPSAATSTSSGEQVQHHASSVSQFMQQHQSQQPASPSDQHSNISSSSIPKLTIKPMAPKDAVTVQNCSSEGSSSATTFGAECLTVSPTVPKLTIKPILPPAKQSGEDSGSSSETSINSLESSPISSCSSAPTSVAVTTSPPTALRMTIKVPSSAPHQQHENSPAGHSTSVALAGGSIASSAAAGATVVTRLNIKPILPPSTSSAELIPGEAHMKDHALMTSDDGDSTPPLCEDSHKPIVIPKVTIKTLANPRSQETEILSTPKVTLKPIPKPQDEATGSPSERHSSLANNTGHSPTNSACLLGSISGSLSDGLDSPRIILKINKGSSSTTTTSGEHLEGIGQDGGPALCVPPSGSNSILANELKRPAMCAMGGTSTLSSSGSFASSSGSSASSTSISASATSSSAGSDPASPSSGGGGDQGEPGSPEVKKSRLDHKQLKLSQQMPAVLEQQKDLLRQSMLQSKHPYQQQLHTATNAEPGRRPVAPGATLSKSSVSDVIVIDDDSKSENEATKEVNVRETLATARADPLAINDRESADRMHPSSFPDSGPAPAHGKSRRTRGTPRGARQSRRGVGRGAGSAGAAAAAARQQQLDANAAVSQLLGLLAQDDREEGSSSDCMIVDEPAALNANVPTSSSSMRESLTLESLLRGGTKPSAPSGSSLSGSSFYSVPMASGGGVGSEVEKNGTASNSSIGSVTSSVSSSVAPVSSTPATSGRTPVAGVRMSTRRAAGQLLKEALGNKHQDRDSGVDEARTDGECGATPSKRPRGRPKKQSVDLAMETNGGGNSNSLDGGKGLEAASDNMLLAMAMIGSADESALMRSDDRALLEAQQLLEGIMPLPRTPARTPSARSRGGRRGPGSRGPRTPRGGGRGAAKAAMAALLAATNTTPSTDIVGSFADLTAAQEAATNQLLDALQQQQEQLLQQMPLSAGAVDVTPKPRGRGRGARGTSGTASRRKGVRGGAKSGRGRKGLELDSPMLPAGGGVAAGELASGATVPVDNKNAIFMTPMAGGLDLNRPKLHMRALKTPKNEIKSSTPPSSAETTPSVGATPSRTPAVDGTGNADGLQVFEEDT
uniref:Uncharacterized protein n=1 Tax=Anopheles christyi TaxID=43041 RepID=A0A182JUL6_9DIPT